MTDAPLSVPGRKGSRKNAASAPGWYMWWDYRAGDFRKNFGMRIDHLLVTSPLTHRVVWAEIDREARKGKPLPPDHAPLAITSTAPAARSMPAGLQRIRELPRAWASSDEPRGRMLLKSSLFHFL
jgi:hypothetical protein